jgi:hypothetical protein
MEWMVNSVRLTMRNYFSSYFLYAARRLSIDANTIEAGHEGESRFDIAHRAYVLSSIQAAAGFLEAMVNELYQDAVDEHGTDGDGYIAPLSAETRRRMAELWRATDEGSKLRPLDKYQMLLVAADSNRLDPGTQPYQDADLLIGLRNTIAHFQPKDLSSDVPALMEKRLRRRFPDNRLMAGAGNPWWPDHCLGHGCCEWAHHAAKSLADRVADELGIRPNYRRHEETGWLDPAGSP